MSGGVEKTNTRTNNLKKKTGWGKSRRTHQKKDKHKEKKTRGGDLSPEGEQTLDGLASAGDGGVV